METAEYIEPVRHSWSCCCNECGAEWDSDANESGDSAENNVCPECGSTCVDTMENEEEEA